MRKKFFRPKIPEICRNSPFLQIFIGLFSYMSLFFHSKILLITMHTIKHGSIVIKTFFEPGTFQKSPEQPIFAGKTIFLEFLELYFILFHEILHTDAKWQCLKCDGVRFCKNFFFWPKMPEICRENRFLGIFSRFHD